jgi:hypothetical protein
MSIVSPTMEAARADARKVFIEQPALVSRVQGVDGTQAIIDLIILGWIAGALYANRQASEFLTQASPPRQAL